MTDTPIAKICGADVELGNFLIGPDGPAATPGRAAAALLDEMPGRPSNAFLLGRFDGDQQDVGRKFLPENGGCVYIDLNHLEICLPEVASAWDHLACWHAMLRLVRQAQDAANSRLRDSRIQVLVNTSDGLGSSYGSHLDFLIARRTWDDMLDRKSVV